MDAAKAMAMHQPQMPKGVEHQRAWAKIENVLQMHQPQMPKGVEHKDGGFCMLIKSKPKVESAS